MFHRFVQKSEQTPLQDLKIAGARMKVEWIKREEFALLNAFLQARQVAGCSQSQAAACMGIQAPAVPRLERALASENIHRRSQQYARYVKACGQRLVLRVS